MIPANKHLLPVASWGLLQVALLGIGASGFPLWAHHPFPRESLALPILLCGQTLAIALFLSAATWKAAPLLLALMLMVPMDELAGLLSNSPQLIILKGFACVGLWMLGLAGWGWVLRDPARLAIAATATLLTAGGAIFDYLRWEACAANGIHFEPITLLPVLWRLDLSVPIASWGLMSTPVLLLIARAGFLELSKRRLKSSSTSLHNPT